MLETARDWADLVDGFRWTIPEHFNMAEAVERHATSHSIALIFDDGRGEARTLTFAEMSEASNRLANALTNLGVAPQDRVAIFLPQRPEVAFTHLAAWKIGAVSVPLTTMFGPHALIQRLGDAETRVLVCEPSSVALLREEVFPSLATPPTLLVVADEGNAVPAGSLSFAQAITQGSPRHQGIRTRADDPAFLSFTSGTTGPAKGALHAHRSLLGHLPGVQLSQNLLPHQGDMLWTPADWSWMGGFMNVVFPGFYFGLPVLAAPRRFDPDEAWALAAKYGVRNTFLPPTALKLMKEVHGPGTPATTFRSVASGGESLGAATLEWAADALGCAVNEFYGQTEVNQVITNCTAFFDPKAGSMGRAVPGHRVTVLDPDLQPVPAGETGQICVGADSPSAFIEYFRKEEATTEKVVNGWILSGDEAALDEDGHFWFAARNDDVITSSGYRIGPSEIEDCLVQHPAVRLAAVVGVPDPVRTELVTAFVELRPEVDTTPELKRDIQDFVRQRVAAHMRPRVIHFIEEIPRTATGKLRRKDLRDQAVAEIAMRQT